MLHSLGSHLEGYYFEFCKLNTELVFEKHIEKSIDPEYSLYHTKKIIFLFMALTSLLTLFLGTYIFWKFFI